ncbi:MAG TPA: hypothetical protein VK466_01535 [Terriglobales bacterium]|nr:hypothetical protein [Terriglobales bacterium]
MTTTATNKPGDPKNDIGWRSFPEFEKILSAEEPPPLLAKVEKTCRQLNSVIEGGSEADQARAKVAMTAYGRSLDLLRILTEARDKAAQS